MPVGRVLIAKSFAFNEVQALVIHLAAPEEFGHGTCEQ